MSFLGLSNEEIVDDINEQLEADGRVSTEFIKVEAVNGRPILSGRVASDELVQIIDDIMTDILDIEDYDNNIWVDDTLAFETEDGDDRSAFGDDENLDDESVFEPEEEEEED